LAVFGLVCLAVGFVFPPAAVVGAVALVELQVCADTVQAKPEHPFWANGTLTDAGDLVKGDELLRSDGLTMPMGQVAHRTEHATTVYNVEAADWHTYLVSWWMFVVQCGYT